MNVDDFCIFSLDSAWHLFTNYFLLFNIIFKVIVVAVRVLQGDDQRNQGNDIENSDNLKIGVVHQLFLF